MKYVALWYVIGLVFMIYWQLRMDWRYSFNRFFFRAYGWRIAKYILIVSLFGPLCYLIGLIGYEISRSE
jgi:hypothetical protein